VFFSAGKMNITNLDTFKVNIFAKNIRTIRIRVLRVKLKENETIINRKTQTEPEKQIKIKTKVSP